MHDLTWEDVKEWKVKQYDCDGKLIQFDCDCINWLMKEVDQLRAELEMATDAANKGDRARHEIQAVIDQNDRLQAELAHWRHKYNDLSELVVNASRLTMKADLIARGEMC